MTPARSAPEARQSLKTLARAAWELGPSSLAQYAAYEIALRSGWLRRRTPIYAWDERPLGRWLRPDVPTDPTAYLAWRLSPKFPRRFFFEPLANLSQPLAQVLGGRRAALLDEAESIQGGRFRLFGGALVDLGFPPRWHAFAPLGDATSPADIDPGRHWTAYPPESFQADVKLLWEPSRFGWVFPLVRAYRLTGDDRFARACVDLIDSWRAVNPPNRGPHWFSGQEVALRILALAFAWYGLAPHLQARPEQAADIVHMVAAHADRLPATLLYARSLANNHLVSEAAGLYTAGVLFPECSGAPRWRSLGRRWIVASLASQVFADGGHVQHSTNYHRAVLQAGLWASRLAEINHEPLPPSTRAALSRMAAFERDLVAPDSGRVPNFGPNDGADLLPLSACPFEDYRPTLQLAAAILRQPELPRGSWDEACVWFGLPRAGSPRLPSSTVAHVDAPQAGVYWLRQPNSSAVLRCAHFRSRPGHSDQLHLYLHHRGRAVLLDAGSYLYNAPPPWDNSLALASAHNGPTLAGIELMRRAGRFLWLEWAQGHVLGRWTDAGGRIHAITAEHHGYRHLDIVVRRSVAALGDDLWMVCDEVLGHGHWVGQTSWLLPDAPSPELSLNGLRLTRPDLTMMIEGANPRLGLYRGGAHLAGETIHPGSPVWGWHSPTYAQKESALSLVCQVEGCLPVRWLTWFCFGDSHSSEARVEWRPVGESPAPFIRLEVRGDVLEVRAG